MKRALTKYFTSKWHLFFAILFLCAFSFNAAAQQVCANEADPSSVSCEKKSCENTTCQIQTLTNGNLPTDCPNGKTKRYDVDPNCVMNKNASAGACMDTMPVASITRVAETNCYRNEGWSRKRNHLGTDYASTAGTVITAAADGTIEFAGNMSGAGRTIIMEHEKKCPCEGSGCDNKFITVYMHMSAFIKTGGSVKKGEPIGYVGGSNYENGILYDDYYSPHLHFEIHSGAYNKGYNTLKKSIINPLCDDIQSFCGGCSNKVEEECTNKQNTSEWTQLDDCAAESKKVTAPPLNLPTGATIPSDGAYPSGSPEDQKKVNDVNTCDYQRFLRDGGDCLFCPLFKALFNTASSLAIKTYNALKDALANVVIIAFALWIAWYVLKQVSALEVKKPSKMIQELLIQAFRVLLVVVILKLSYAQILRLTLDPIFNTGMKYIQTVTVDTKDDICPPSASYMQGLKGYETQMDTSSSGALPISMGQNILCSIKSMQSAVWRVIAFGRECICVSWLKDIAYIKHVLPHFGYFLTGVLLIIGGLLLLLAFPWCLVDCILNMAIAAALLPAAIAAWAFKITSGYLKTLFNFFLNAMFNFVFLSIILYIIITVVDQFVQVTVKYSTDYDKLIDPLHGIAFWSVNGLKLLMVCLLGWVFLDKGKNLANEFAKAPSLDIGKKTGGLFAQVGKRMAMGSKDKDGKYHGGALGIIKGGGQLAGLAGNRFIGMPARKAFNNARNKWVMKRADPLIPKKNQILKTSADGKTKSLYDKHGNLLRTQQTLDDGTLETRNAKGKLISSKTTDANGNAVYELNRGSLIGSHNILGKKITRRVTLGADGSAVYTKERENVSTQLKNKARDAINKGRVNQFQSQDQKTFALFDQEPTDDQTVQTSDDGKTKSIFNKNGKLIRTQTTLDDGTVEIRNASGKFVASKKIDENGNTVLTRRHGTSVYNANGVLLSADKSYRNPFLGFEKQTLSVKASQNQKYDVTRTTTARRMEILGALAKDGSKLQSFAQGYDIKRERDLSSRVGTTSSVTQDHLLSIRQIKNAQGEVIQEDYAFNPKFVKYLVERDGTINTNIVRKLQEETKLTQEQINMAIAEQILKDRGIKLSNKFADRNIFFEDGVLTVVQKNSDGSTSRLSTQMIGNQMLVDMEIINGNNATHIFDNGTITRVISKHDGKESTVHYSFNDRIKQNSNVQHLINYGGKRGQFAPSINQDAAMLGLSQQDIAAFAEQEINGEDNIYGGNYDPKERQDKIDSYREANQFRRQAEQNAAQDLSDLNKTRQELETLKETITSQNSAQLQGKLNLLNQKLKQAEASYNRSVAEYNRWRQREYQTRAEL